MSLASRYWVFLLVVYCGLAEGTTYDSALWSGGLVLFENEDSIDYSVEYQLRLDDHMSSFSNHFVEFMGYQKVNENLILNGGYRFTRRTEHVESRLYFRGLKARYEKDYAISARRCFDNLERGIQFRYR